jgi:hypothetical protein
VVVHNLAAGKSRELAVAATLIGGVDGMVWYKGSLIGVQNLANAGVGSRLLRITPDGDAQKATIEVLLAGTDFPGSATTVAVAGEEAFVIGRTTGTSGKPVEPFLIRAPLQ